MNEAEDLVRRFWALMASNAFHRVAEVLHPEFELEWPQSGERIRGARNFAAMNANYPAAGPWQFTVNRLVVEDQSAVTDTTVTDGAIIARAITFFTVRDGLVHRITEYWPEPFEPGSDRGEWVERDGKD